MKKIVLLFIAFITAGIVKAQELVVDPNASQRTISGSFTKIKVSGGIDLFLSQSDNEAVAVSASEDRFKDDIKTVVENGTLRIYYEWEKNMTFRNRKLKAYVSFKTLEALNVSGACDVLVQGTINSESLGMVLSGASDFKGAVKVNKLTIDLSGASDIRISGTANTVDIESSGASDVKGYDLVTDYCNAKATGASDINITVNKELNAHAGGASDISYKGTALIRDMHSSGSSSISKKKGR
jgi:hypothetical protein